MSQSQVEALISLNKAGFEAEDAGRKFYAINVNFNDAQKEARKRYNSVLLQECFMMGRNLAFWGR